MPVFRVNVKWGKEKFENVEVDTSEPPEVFRAQLFALSGVLPERQKVMVKGSTLKDDAWGNFKIKDGITILMMGTADALPKAPETRTMFVEDMSDSQIASAYQLPAGLTNLGNTCYMNATVQCLKNVPELRESLTRYQGQLSLGNIMANPSDAVTIGLRDLYKTMDKTTEELPPIIFLQILHTVFPQFAEKNEQGVFQQQDANECWTQIIRMLQQQLPAIKSGTVDEQAAAVSQSRFIDQYFGLRYKTSLKCDEASDEPEQVSNEKVYQLSCFISQDVKFMHTGLRSRLKESITKTSPTLSRDAQYTKTSLIDRLPAYLTVQFVRFYYKEKEKVNAKILKDVKFSLTLDVFDLCTPELQQKLVPMRDKFKIQEDKDVERIRKQKEKVNSNEGSESMDVEQKEIKKTTFPYEFEDDPGSNNSGYYELSAVLTHRGRSSSSGHYVGWVRKKGDDWIMCDDDKVSPVTSQDILKLSGGGIGPKNQVWLELQKEFSVLPGDWHIAYVLLYAPKQLELDEEQT